MPENQPISGEHHPPQNPVRRCDLSGCPPDGTRQRPQEGCLTGILETDQGLSNYTINSDPSHAASERSASGSEEGGRPSGSSPKQPRCGLPYSEDRSTNSMGAAASSNSLFINQASEPTHPWTGPICMQVIRAAAAVQPPDGAFDIGVMPGRLWVYSL